MGEVASDRAHWCGPQLLTNACPCREWFVSAYFHSATTIANTFAIGKLCQRTFQQGGRHVTTPPQFAIHLGPMFTAQQIILGGGLLVLAWAIIQGLVCRGGHVKSVPLKQKRKAPVKR